MSKQWWTLRELRELYQIPRSTMYKIEKSGTLVIHNLDGVKRVSEEDRLAWERSKRSVRPYKRKKYDPIEGDVEVTEEDIQRLLSRAKSSARRM